MELVFKVHKQELKINIDKNVILFGKNDKYKNYILNNIIYSFTDKDTNSLINYNKININDYNIIQIDEDADFEKEFKFVKNNVLRQLIFDEIIENTNTKKLVNYTNEVFGSIDEKVNSLLDRKINNHLENKVFFETKIQNVNSIIDKFTNIYIDDILLNSKNISKATKKKILFELYFYGLKKNKSKNNIVIINNFDAFLDNDEIIDVLSKINAISSEQCHFILTSCKNIFEYISLLHFNVYKVNGKLIPLKNIDNAIKNFIIKNEFNNTTYKSFEKFYKDYESFIQYNEIDTIKYNVFNKYPYNIGKILNCNNIKIVKRKPKDIKNEYIICRTKELNLLFTEIYNQFID